VEIQSNHKIQPEVLKSVTSGKQKKKSKKKDAVKEILEVKKPADSEYKWSLIYPLLREKVPLFVLAILSSILTYVAQQNRGLVTSFDMIPMSVRIGNALISYIAYIGKMIWPSNLAVLYPHPGLLVPWQVLGAVLLLIAITVLVIWRIKRFPYLAIGWLWYLGTLVPVIGIVQVATQAMADRFTYIPLIGLFIIAAWGVPDLLKKWNYRKEILVALSALSILCLAIITWKQVGYWQNSITLYDHSLKVTDNNMFIYYNRGFYYHNLGNYRQAIEDYNRAIEINPRYAWAYLNRGNAYNLLGNYKKAIENFDRAIEIKPGSALAYNNRGNTYNVLGNYKKAIENFDRAIDIKPGFALAYNNRGAAYLMLGNKDYGCPDVQKACSLGKCQALEFAKGKGYCR
jgi:tetratricopeptide (TPR) repeat protein